MDTIMILKLAIGVIIFIMMLLAAVYYYLTKASTKTKKEKTSVFYSETQITEEEKKKVENFGRFHGELNQESIFEFMEFDEIVDNMIIRKNKTQYIMILQCYGINYDLMSEQEKISVEEGFIQFLNTLRTPIQLYIQSRTLNLSTILTEYKGKINDVSNDIEKLNAKILQAKRTENTELRDKLELEKRRKQNILSYGTELTDYVERLNSNKNILQQKIYLVVSFFVNELGENLEIYSKEEVNNMCFSELYTRAQNLSSSLSSAQVTSRILDSEEIAELLYVAYNRDESEIYSLRKALDAQYDALYSSGKDILLKKQEKLDREINIEAIDLATDSILRADKQKQNEDLKREREKIQRVREKATELLENYEDKLDPRVYEIAKENVKKETKIKEDRLLNKEDEEKEKSIKKLPKGEKKLKSTATDRKVTVVHKKHLDKKKED